MIEFIDPERFYAAHINFAFIIVIATLLHSRVVNLNDPKNLTFINVAGNVFFVFIVLLIGLRPISGANFGDMVTYAKYFNYYAQGGQIISIKDTFFHYYMQLCSQILPIHAFFTLCTILYVYPMYRIARVFFKEYWFYAFLMLIVSFSFWNYGTNGIRNGMATSIFLLGLSYKNNKVLMYFIFFIAYSIHQTLLLPIAAFTLTYIYNNPKTYLIGWFAAIPLSIALGGFWENLFASLGFGDGRLGGYLLGEADPESFKNVGFRWDFLIYSGSAVFTGWYFIFKKGFNDIFYHQLYNVYLLANGFWILVIRANFSNRFAYLSWFIIAIIIVYPFLKKQFYRDQHLVIGRVVLAYYSFTLFMFYIYYGNKAT